MEVHRGKFIFKRLKMGFSLSRYGDGELKVIRGGSITNMQKYDEVLKQKLLKVFEHPLSKLLIGIPDPLCTRPYVSKFHRYFDKFILGRSAKEKSVFVSSFFSRPSLVSEDSEVFFGKMKGIWKEREIVLINFNPELPDHFLFRDNKSEFIQISRNNCFSEYKRIMSSCQQFYNQNKLFLISAGPVATCLAYDLCSVGEQAIDIGGIAFEQSLFAGDLHPERWVYQDSYKIKRGYLKGINDMRLNDVKTNITHTKAGLQRRKDAGIVMSEGNFVRLLNAFMYFVQYTDKQLPLLDVGTREGWFLKFLTNTGYVDVQAIEVCPDAISMVRRSGFKVTEMDVQKMEFQDMFGTITAIHVLEHCSNPVKAVENIYNALRRNGVLYVEIPLETKVDPNRSGHFSCFPEVKNLLVLFDNRWKVLSHEVQIMNKAGTKKNCRALFKKI